MRGTLTALVVVLLVASGAWAAPVSAVAESAAGTGTATDGGGDGSGAVATITTTDLNETAENTTNATDSTVTPVLTETGTTDTTDSSNSTDTADATDTTDDGNTTDTTDDVTNTTDDATNATVNGSVWGTSVDAELATNGSAVTTSATIDGDDPLAVSAETDATVDASGNLLASSATIDVTGTTDAETPTPTETAGENDSAGSGDGGSADDGASDSETDGDVPAAAGGAALAGFGAAAVTLLVRRSATLAALASDVAATVSRLPSPLAQIKGTVREWLPRVLAAVGYSRYDDSDPLTHATRAALYDRIADSPGTYLSELSEQTDVPTSTVRHHLDVLVREGVVTTANVRGKRRYFSLDAGDETLAAALSDDASAAVIECLAETGPASVSAVAEELDRDVSTVSHHLGRLAEDGLVEREQEGRSVYSELAPEVEDALEADRGEREPRRA